MSSSCLVGAQKAAKGDYVGPVRVHPDQGVTGSSLEVCGCGALVELWGRWLSGKIPGLDHPRGSFA